MRVGKQSGYTLLELLVAVAITGVIALGITLTIQNVFRGTTNNRGEVIVLDNLNTAAIYLKRDIQSYETANLTDLESGNVTFRWIDRTGFLPEDERDHIRVYSLSDDGILYRTADNLTSVIARYITDVTFTLNGDYMDVFISAESNLYPFHTDNLSFSIYKRTEEEG